jgi:hypothetical protein
MQAISSTFSMKVKIKDLLIAFRLFSLIHNPLNLGSIQGVTMEVEIRIAVSF